MQRQSNNGRHFPKRRDYERFEKDRKEPTPPTYEKLTGEGRLRVDEMLRGDGAKERVKKFLKRKDLTSNGAGEVNSELLGKIFEGLNNPPKWPERPTLEDLRVRSEYWEALEDSCESLQSD